MNEYTMKDYKCMDLIMRLFNWGDLGHLQQQIIEDQKEDIQYEVAFADSTKNQQTLKKIFTQQKQKIDLIQRKSIQQQKNSQATQMSNLFQQCQENIYQQIQQRIIFDQEDTPEHLICEIEAENEKDMPGFKDILYELYIDQDYQSIITSYFYSYQNNNFQTQYILSYYDNNIDLREGDLHVDEPGLYMRTLQSQSVDLYIELKNIDTDVPNSEELYILVKIYRKRKDGTYYDSQTDVMEKLKTNFLNKRTISLGVDYDSYIRIMINDCKKLKEFRFHLK